MAVQRHPPPAVNGKRIKPKYMAQLKGRPPTFVLFATRAESLPEQYRRYLINSLRESFDLQGTPIRITIKSGKNPYAEESDGNRKVAGPVYPKKKATLVKAPADAPGSKLPGKRATTTAAKAGTDGGDAAAKPVRARRAKPAVSKDGPSKASVFKATKPKPLSFAQKRAQRTPTTHKLRKNSPTRPPKR